MAGIWQRIVRCDPTIPGARETRHANLAENPAWGAARFLAAAALERSDQPSPSLWLAGQVVALRPRFRFWLKRGYGATARKRAGPQGIDCDLPAAWRSAWSAAENPPKQRCSTIVLPAVSLDTFRMDGLFRDDHIGR